MGKTQYHTAMTLDGYIADKDNSLDWLFQVDRETGESSHSDRFFAGVGAMAMGATTYQWLLDHVHLLDEPATWQSWYGSTPSWVFTHRSLPAVPGADIRFVQDDVAPVTLGGGAPLLPRRIVGGMTLVGVERDRQFANLTYNVDT